MSFKPDLTKLFDLTGRVAIVTGGAGILGHHFCHGLVNHGAKVVIADLNLKPAEGLAKQLSSNGADVLAIQVDVSDDSSVQNMIKQVINKYGKIDILHNNAATKTSDLKKYFAPLESYDMQIWKEAMTVNVDGMFLVARAVGENMIKQGIKGSIIQTASIYGLMAPDQRIYAGSQYMGMPINTPPVYTTSKAAVLGLTKHLASYWADKGIRVNSITPGGTSSGQNNEFHKKYSARIPMGRMAEPEEIVGALIFLASDASSYITGQNISVDGGLSVW